MKGIGKLLKGAAKDIGTAELVGMGINAAFTIGDIKDAKREGYSTTQALMKGIGTNVAIDVIGLPSYLGYKALVGTPKAAIRGYEKLTSSARQLSSYSANKPFQTANFVDTQQAFTMRQAGMKLAQASKYNIQQATLGNEANFIRY